ncbi:MAG: glycoside hydrolase family 172 protein [Candidatus Aminicenantales bacterium]
MGLWFKRDLTSRPRLKTIAYFLIISSFLGFSFLGAALMAQDLLRPLATLQDYRSSRVSSFDRTGGNRDYLTIEPGETAVLASLKGPGAIHHIWVTIAAEPFYGRKLVLRMYWDGEKDPSVEAPIGDFFGVGHGLLRNFSSLPINCSSEGRAKNCYWYMPFQKEALITVTNEGSEKVRAFYYYIDYRLMRSLPADTPYFHAQYRQEMPCIPNQNYLILEAKGRGHYVGCNLSILERSMGWWGEGDDMIYVDDETFPSLHGTGSEDYFSDAWGMREDENPFYGCPLQEEDFLEGSKATVYRFHLPDPIPFRKSIKVTIEHGHANDRSDFFSSVAYWYQVEPHTRFTALPSVKERLPFALETPPQFIFPHWEESEREGKIVFIEREKGLKLTAPQARQTKTAYYQQTGERYPVVLTEGAKPGIEVKIICPVEVTDKYNVDLYFLKGPLMGNFRVILAEEESGAGSCQKTVSVFSGYSAQKEIGILSLKDLLLRAGENRFYFVVEGKEAAAEGMEIGFIGLSLVPAERNFIRKWNILGPFEAPDMESLQKSYPPESEVDLAKHYLAKGGLKLAWIPVEAEESGYIRLETQLQPNEQVVAYGLVYVFSPEAQATTILLGSDDAVRVWLNDVLVHSNAVYRGAWPDEDKVNVELRPGWNKLLVKVLQGSGGWGFYLRFADPENKLCFSLQPGEEK